MTDCDIASLAKAGDRRAADELLRRHLPEVRRIVGHELARQRASFELYDDAVAEAMFALWRSIPAWDPNLAPLIAFARTNMLREVWRIAAYCGHAVAVPVAAARNSAKHVRRRRQALRPCRSAEQPISEADDAPIYRDILAAPPIDIAAAIDAGRILREMPERDRELLWRVACDESYAEIGGAIDRERRAVFEAYKRAVEHARKVAGSKAKGTPKRRPNVGEISALIRQQWAGGASIRSLCEMHHLRESRIKEIVTGRWA